MYASVDDQIIDFGFGSMIDGPAATVLSSARRFQLLIWAQVVGVVMAASLFVWSDATLPTQRPLRVASVERAILDPETTGSLPPLLRPTFPD